MAAWPISGSLARRTYARCSAPCSAAASSWTAATKGLEGVADAIAEMERLVPISGSRAAVILLITRYIEDPSRSVAVVAAQNQANQAKSEFIPIYTLSTDLGQFNQEPLQILAEISNGRKYLLQRTTAGALAENA